MVSDRDWHWWMNPRSGYAGRGDCYIPPSTPRRHGEAMMRFPRTGFLCLMESGSCFLNQLSTPRNRRGRRSHELEVVATCEERANKGMRESIRWQIRLFLGFFQGLPRKHYWLGNSSCEEYDLFEEAPGLKKLSRGNTTEGERMRRERLF